MKFVLLYLALAAVVLVTSAQIRPDGKYINRLPPPTQPPKYRWKREPNPETGGSITVTHEKQSGQRPTTNIEYQQKIFENKNGQISVGAGASKTGGQRWDTNVGIQGSFRWKREPTNGVEDNKTVKPNKSILGYNNGQVWFGPGSKELPEGQLPIGGIQQAPRGPREVEDFIEEINGYER